MPHKGTRGIGDRGEAHARRVLAGAGWSVVECNFRTRQGEIDVVAERGGEFAFVEVKARRSRSLGPPELSVTALKQRKIARAALVWLAARGKQGAPMHFHVVSVTLGHEGGASEVRLIEDAFAPAGMLPGMW